MTFPSISRRAARVSAFVAAAVSMPTVAHAVGGPAPGAVSAQTVTAPSGPGSVRGLAADATVSAFSGQVEYRVPIELPTSAGGFAPTLALTYRGELGNGPLGVGWSLPLPAIRRSLRFGVPSYTAADALELVGLPASGELIAIADGEYRLEGQGNDYVIRDLAGGGLLLIDPSGLELRFGTTAAARLAEADSVAAWYLEEIRDLAGQTIEYRYRRDRGELYLDEIQWGPDVAGARVFRVELVHGERPDPVIGYRTGFRVETAERVEQILVSSFGEVVRTVDLGYDDSFALSRLAGVRVTGRGGEDELPALTLTYAAIEAPRLDAVAGVDGWALNLAGTSLFDVDDDGAADLLRLRQNGHSYRRNLGASFGPATALPGAPGAALDRVRLLDLDGDSAAELVWQQGSQWVVYRLDAAGGRRWVEVGRWGGSQGVALDTAAIADLDGDGRMDVLSVSGQKILVRFGSDSGLGASVRLPAIDASRSYIQPGNAATMFPDINGDGLADVVYAASSALYLYLGTGDGQFTALRDVAYPWTGTVDTSQLRLSDLNRDGLLDVAVVRAGNVAWYRGRADGSVETTAVALPRPPGTDATVVVAIADGNGNGSDDVVWSSTSGMWLVDLAGSTSAGMLTAIDNGLGQVQRFGYQASSQLALADEAAGEAWTSTMPISIPVAVTTRIELASGEPTRSTRLDVRDGVYARDERRFVGFTQSAVTRPDPDLGGGAAVVRQVQRFHPGLGADRALRGRVVSDRIEDGAGLVYRDTSHQLAAVAVSGLPAGEPRLRRAVVTATRSLHHEGQTAAIATSVAFGHDDDGRIIEERRSGRDDVTGDESIVRRRYTTGRSSRGVRNKVCEEWRYGLAGEPATEVLVSHRQILYGDLDTVAALCDASAGWERVTRGYLDGTEPRWIDLTRTRYDRHGNPVETYQAGVIRRLNYDEHGLHPVAEITAPDADRELRWEATWDDVLGQPTAIRDAAGTSTQTSFDGLGRLLSTAVDGSAAHAHVRYHWVGPRPYVESFDFDGDPGAVTALPATWTADSGWRHQVAVFGSAGEPMFNATRLDVDRWLIEARRQRDALGRTVAIADPFAWTGSLAELVSGAVPAGDVVRTVAYDGLDRVVEQGLPTASRNVFTYRAFETTIATDGLAPVTTTLDGEGRIVRTSRTVDGTVEAVTAQYDAAGRIVAMRVGGGDDASAEQHFEYDTLGRMVGASDADIGERVLTYDDAGRLIAHRNGAAQTTTYGYDGAGRLASMSAGDGLQFHYHYDQPRDAGFAHTAGRLVWIEEPTGRVELGYDTFGRTHRWRRTVNDEVADETTTHAPSGLVRSIDHGDGVVIDYRHDAAGRTVAIGDLWAAEEQDAAGRLVRERFGNGVVQSYQRDAVGQATRIQIVRSGGPALYDAVVAYGPYGAIATVSDDDGVGLDHSASFGYDGGARLREATLGRGAAQYRFGYQYDGLQNMVRRDSEGPTSLAILTGTYRYGEADDGGGARGPRQLTSVAAADGDPSTVTGFDYDGAGRLIRQGGLGLDYDGFDRLVRVRNLPSAAGATGVVEHAYGHDGQRVLTRDPTGASEIWFSAAASRRDDGVRDTYVRLGERLIARFTRSPAELGSRARAEAARTGSRVGAGIQLALGGAGLFGILLVLAGAQRRRGRRAVAALTVLAVMLSACGTSIRSRDEAVTSIGRTLYYHQAIGAGPTIITRSDGTVFEERRYEPFGAPIDAFRERVDGSPEIGTVDPGRDPHNELNKPTDPATGWSYHGARWMAPETGRWLTPDPPVKAPDPAFMVTPWSLHPYQYVNQNPVLFWDPDGEETKQQQWIRHFEAHYARYQGVGRIHGTHDPGVMTETGVRVPADDGNFLAQRPFYENRNAAFVAWQGFTHYAELIEAGHDAAALQIYNALGRMPRDNELDLYAYTGWSRRAVDARQTMEVSISAGEASVTLASRLARNPLAGARYTGKVRQQMRPGLKTGRPDNHGFPLEVDNFAQHGKVSPLTGGDGIVRTKVELPGSYNGKDGHFEWIIENDGTINHRLFVAD
jgi:RHS repeat-associated protein